MGNGRPSATHSNTTRSPSKTDLVSGITVKLGGTGNQWLKTVKPIHRPRSGDKTDFERLLYGRVFHVEYTTI